MTSSFRPSLSAALPRRLLRAAARGLALLSLGAGALAQGPADPRLSYAWDLPLLVPDEAVARAALLRVQLPQELLKNLRSEDGSDIGVFNGRDEPVPVAWLHLPDARPVRRSVTALAWPVGPEGRALRLGGNRSQARIVHNEAGAMLFEDNKRKAFDPRGPDTGSTVWLLDLLPQPGEVPVALWLQWQPPGDDQTVTTHVSASASGHVSDPGMDWEPVGSWQVHSSRRVPGAAARRIAPKTTLPAHKAELDPLPSADTRYLRLDFRTPVRLNGVQVDMRPRVEASLHLHASGFSSEISADDWMRGGPWEFKLPFPVRLGRMRATLPQRHTPMDVLIEQRPPATGARGARRDWVVVDRYTVDDSSRYEGPELKVDAPAAREWRVRRFDRPSPLEATLLKDPPSVRLTWQQPELAFVALGPGPFGIALGRERGFPLLLDRAELMPDHREGAQWPLQKVETKVLRPMSFERTDRERKEARRLAGPPPWHRWLRPLLAGSVALFVLALAWRFRPRRRPARKGR